MNRFFIVRKISLMTNGGLSGVPVYANSAHVAKCPNTVPQLQLPRHFSFSARSSATNRSASSSASSIDVKRSSRRPVTLAVSIVEPAFMGCIVTAHLHVWVRSVDFQCEIVAVRQQKFPATRGPANRYGRRAVDGVWVRL